jgi:hypothetical protein
VKKGIIAIVVLGIVAVVAWQQWRTHKPVVELKGVVGGEKVGLMEDQQIADIFKNRFNLSLKVSKAGSIEMVERDPGQNDFLFPGSQIATEMFKSDKGGKVAETQTIFRSPLVIYSWDNTAQALIKQGIVKQIDGSYYIEDLPRLVKMMVDGKNWSDVGLPYYGKITITTTDPNYSNSGAMFAGLLADLLGGDASVADESNIDARLPALKTFFGRLGYMEHSSSDLFETYLSTGEGSKPLVVGYENQMIEYAAQRPELWNRSKDKVRVLYPMPTCWSAHELIALNEPSRELIKALSDIEVQKLAWNRHGFRSGTAGTASDTQILGNIAIPERLDKIVPLPNYRTMDKILKSLKQ